MRTLVISLLMSLLLGCHKHAVTQTQHLSRQLTTIQFSASNQPYSVKEEVGGEQINITKIKAKANETYLIEVISDNDSLSYYIDGPSITVQKTADNSFKTKVTAQQQTVIELSFIAHPESSVYELKITKL